MRLPSTLSSHILKIMGSLPHPWRIVPMNDCSYCKKKILSLYVEMNVLKHIKFMFSFHIIMELLNPALKPIQTFPMHQSQIFMRSLLTGACLLLKIASDSSFIISSQFTVPIFGTFSLLPKPNMLG